jgi:hypothetical protein
MQQLHGTLYGIGERAESEVVTIFRVGEPARAQARYATSGFYEGFPITVEITSRANTSRAVRSASMSGFLAALKRRMSAVNLSLLAKTGLATAAVILIAAALLFNIPTAGAVTFEQVYKAIAKVQNVHISNFAPPKSEPIQEMWVSQALNIYAMKTESEYVLFDISGLLQKSKNLDSGVKTISQLTRASVAPIKSIMDHPLLKFMPFANNSEVPENSQWERIYGDQMYPAAGDVQVYELAWVDGNYPNLGTFKKWRFFVNSKTHLPHKIEAYRKLPHDTEYNLISSIMVEYPSVSNIQADVNALF